MLELHGKNLQNTWQGAYEHSQLRINCGINVLESLRIVFVSQTIQTIVGVEYSITFFVVCHYHTELVEIALLTDEPFQWMSFQSSHFFFCFIAMESI